MDLKIIVVVIVIVLVLFGFFRISSPTGSSVAVGEVIEVIEEDTDEKNESISEGEAETDRPVESKTYK